MRTDTSSQDGVKTSYVLIAEPHLKLCGRRFSKNYLLCSRWCKFVTWSNKLIFLKLQHLHPLDLYHSWVSLLLLKLLTISKVSKQLNMSQLCAWHNTFSIIYLKYKENKGIFNADVKTLASNKARKIRSEKIKWNFSAGNILKRFRILQQVGNPLVLSFFSPWNASLTNLSFKPDSSVLQRSMQTLMNDEL